MQTHIPILTWAVPSRWRGAELAEEQLCALILPDCRYLSKKSASLWEHETPNMEIQKIHTGIWNYTGISLFSSLAIANKICFFSILYFYHKEHIPCPWGQAPATDLISFFTAAVLHATLYLQTAIKQRLTHSQSTHCGQYRRWSSGSNPGRFKRFHPQSRCQQT